MIVIYGINESLLEEILTSHYVQVLNSTHNLTNAYNLMAAATSNKHQTIFTLSKKGNL